MLTLSSLKEHCDRYEAALTWLASLDTRIGGTRLARYLSILRKAEQREAQGLEEHQGAPPFLNALVESSEITDIAQLDRAWLIPDVLGKLQLISGGPEVMAPDRDDPARNYAFEFSAAAVLDSTGGFGGFSQHGGDLTVGALQSPAECKRVSSLNSLERRLREGRRKLETLLRNGAHPGVICVDLTRPIRITLGPITTVDDQSLVYEAEQRLSAYVATYVLKRKHLDALSCPAALGLIFRYVGIGTAGSVENVRRSTVWQACSLHRDDSVEDRAFQDIAQHFGSEPLKAGTAQELVAAAQRFPV